MHIVYVISPGGGPDAYVKTISPWLIQQGHRVSVIYAGVKPFPSQLHAEIEVYFTTPRHGHYYLGKITGQYRLLARRFRSLELSWESARIISQIHKSQPVDVVEMTEGYYVRGISKRWAVILRAHGSDWAFRHFCEEDDTTWDQIAINEQARQFRHAHVVSPLSKHYSEYLSAVCNLPGYMFQELPYPIDIDRFTPIGRSNPDIIHNSLMTIGRLEHRKGSDVAVQAMNSVWKSVDDARLYMLGSESQFTRNSLAGLADKKHRGQVMFPGFIEHGHLPSYYRAIKAYFAPTQYETLGYTILEAMSCGVPVVACPTGAVPELVEDGVNGKLVPFGQPEYAAQEIINLLKDEPKRQNMGTKARETALKYSLNIIGAKHVEMYERARSIFIKQLGSKE